MKKWLGEASALCGHAKSNQETNSKNESKVSRISENGSLQQCESSSELSHIGGASCAEVSISTDPEVSNNIIVTLGGYNTNSHVYTHEYK